MAAASDHNDGKRLSIKTSSTHFLAEDDDVHGEKTKTEWSPYEYLTGTIQGQIIVLVCGAIVLVVSGAVTWKFAGGNELYDNTWTESFWFAWGMFFDPGTEMGFDAKDSHWNKTLAAGFSVLGFLYNLLLLGLLVEQARRILTFYYRKGNRIVANGHTLLLGWNENVLFMLNELVHAAVARKATERFVILADQDAEFMQQRIDYNFPTHEHLKGQRVTPFSGHPCERNDLTKVSAKSAREIICLGPGSTTCPRSFDQDTTQIIVALASLPEEPSGEIIASIRSPDAAPVVDAIMVRAEGVVAKDLINRMMCLKALRPTVGRCCELLATFLHDEKLSCRTLPDLGLDPDDCRTFGAVRPRLKHGIAVGIKRTRRPGSGSQMNLSIAPQDGAALEKDEELLVLINNNTEPRKESFVKYAAADEAGGKIIIAGWRYNMLEIIEALNMYLDQQIELHIIANIDEGTQVQQLDYHPDSTKRIEKVVHHCGSRALSKDLQKLPLKQAHLILVLADCEDEDANTSDSSCLACAITLADMVEAHKPPQSPHLICELHATRTARMLRHNEELNSRADFFHTNAVESGLIATAAASRAVYNCLGMLMEPDGCNLTCSPVRDYIGGSRGATFNQLATTARTKNELLIGYRHVSEDGEELCLQPHDCDVDLDLQSQDELILIRGGSEA